MSDILTADARRTLIERFARLHAEAAAHRDRRPDMVDTGDGWEFEWVLYERAVMRSLVNQIRRERGFLPIGDAAVLRIERSAEGHSDYARQFSVGCADLAVTPDNELDPPA